MTIHSDRARGQLPPPSRIDRGVPGVFHRRGRQRRTRRRRVFWTVRERRLGPRIEREVAGWGVALHSRLPDDSLECPPIDHLVVAPAGVWIILADHQLKRLSPAAAAAATVFSRREEIAHQVRACREVLESIGFDWLDIQLAMCATNAQGTLRRSLRIDDVWVGRPSSLSALLAGPGPMSPLDVSTVAAELSRRFPAAR